MSRQFRAVLPLSIGILSAVLLVWDFHNQRVISSMGMAWDTGAPLWPYQTPAILLFALNTPAYIVAAPIADVLQMNVFPLYYIVLFPAILFWWCFVGLVLDGSLLQRQTRPRWLLLASAIFSDVLFVVVGTRVSSDAFVWWFQYSDGVFTPSTLIMVRLMAPAIWCFLFAFAAAIVAKRLTIN